MKLIAFFMLCCALFFSCESTDFQEPMVQNDIAIEEIIIADEEEIVEDIAQTVDSIEIEKEPNETLIQEVDELIDIESENIPIIIEDEELALGVEEPEVIALFEEEILLDDIPETIIDAVELEEPIGEDTLVTEGEETVTVPLIALTEAIEVEGSEVEEIRSQLPDDLDNDLETITDTLLTDENTTTLEEDIVVQDDVIIQDTVIIDSEQVEATVEPIQVIEDDTITQDTVIIDSEQVGPTVEPIQVIEDDTITQDIVVLDTNGNMVMPQEEQSSQEVQQVDELIDSVVLTDDVVEEIIIDETVREEILATTEMASAIDTPIAPSQKVEVYEEDYVDIILAGQGWIYLGEVKETDPIVLDFYSRYIDGDDTLFNFYGENSGTTILHFYKQDILANEYLDEYIEVIVNPIKKAIQEQPKASSRTEELYGISSEPEVSFIGGQTEKLQDEVYDDGFSPEDILEEAQLAFDEKRYQDSLYLLDEYTSLGVEDIDRALFLYGKNYESNSDVRNIRLSHSSYEKIIESFPNSNYWDEATKRATYLERFYLNIR